jgi:hypothetical protein
VYQKPSFLRGYWRCPSRYRFLVHASLKTVSVPFLLPIASNILRTLGILQCAFVEFIYDFWHELSMKAIAHGIHPVFWYLPEERCISIYLVHEKCNVANDCRSFRIYTCLHSTARYCDLFGLICSYTYRFPW